MKTKHIFFPLSPAVLYFFLLTFSLAYGNSQQKLYNEGKNACIDHNWNKAINRFEKFMDRYPESQYMDEVQFWLGYSLEKIPERQVEAFKTFGNLVKNYSNSPWRDNAMVHQIRLAEKFVSAGKEEYRAVLAERLSSENRDVQYRAAVALGKLGDKQALPVLRQIQEHIDLGGLASALVTFLESDSIVVTLDSEVERPKKVKSIFASKKYKQYRSMLRKDDGWSKQELVIFGMWHILKSDEFEEYHSLTDEYDRIQWYENYWQEKADKLDFNESELRNEFERRVIFTRTFFSDVSEHLDRKYRADQYLLPGEFRAPWDARGELYIKYGEPSSRNLAHWDGLDSEHWEYPNYEIDFIVYQHWTNIYLNAVQNGPTHYGFHETDRWRFEHDYLENAEFYYNTGFITDSFKSLFVNFRQMKNEEKGNLLVGYGLEGVELNDVVIDKIKQHILFVDYSVLDDKYREILHGALTRAIILKNGPTNTLEGKIHLSLDPGKYIVRLKIQDFCSHKISFFEQELVVHQ